MLSVRVVVISATRRAVGRRWPSHHRKGLVRAVTTTIGWIFGVASG
jgi:hypothetical protein